MTRRIDYINGMEVNPSTLTTVVHLAGGRLVKQVSGIWDPLYLLVVTENRNCSLLQAVNPESLPSRDYSAGRGCHQFFAVSSPIRHYYTDHRGDAIIDDVRYGALGDHHFQTYGGLKVGVGFGLGGSFQFTETRIIGRATTIGWFPFMNLIY